MKIDVKHNSRGQYTVSWKISTFSFDGLILRVNLRESAHRALFHFPRTKLSFVEPGDEPFDKQNRERGKGEPVK